MIYNTMARCPIHLFKLFLSKTSLLINIILSAGLSWDIFPNCLLCRWHIHLIRCPRHQQQSPYQAIGAKADNKKHFFNSYAFRTNSSHWFLHMGPCRGIMLTWVLCSATAVFRSIYVAKQTLEGFRHVLVL